MATVWKIAGVPAFASQDYKEREPHHLGSSCKEMRFKLATLRTKVCGKTRIVTEPVSASMNVSQQTSRRQSLLCAPLIGLGLTLSPASAEARPNRVEGRGDAMKELKEYREKALQGIEEIKDEDEDTVEEFAAQVQSFVEEQKAATEKEVAEAVEETVLKVDGMFEDAKEAVNASVEAVQGASKSADVESVSETVQSGIGEGKAVIEKFNRTVEKVIEAPPAVEELKAAVAESTGSAGRAISKIVDTVSPKLSFEEGMRKIRELQGV